MERHLLHHAVPHVILQQGMQPADSKHHGLTYRQTPVIAERDGHSFRTNLRPRGTEVAVKILKGEYKAQILVMIIINFTPSLYILIPLLPVFLFFMLIGTYFRLLPFLKTPKVKVVG